MLPAAPTRYTQRRGIADVAQPGHLALPGTAETMSRHVNPTFFHKGSASWALLNP
jgi:hypothetical protein